MARHVTHQFESRQALADSLCGRDMYDAAATASAILVQVFSADTDPAQLLDIRECISTHWPDAVVVGATSIGEIASGCLLTGSIVIGFTFFESSRVHAFAVQADAVDAGDIGADLGHRISALDAPVAGILLLATTLTIDVVAVMRGLDETGPECLLFGGGAADYAGLSHSLVLSAGQCMTHGVVAVALSGPDLHVEAQSYLGWRPLSKAMRITRVSGLLIEQIDDMPAFEVYRHYLNVAGGGDFFLDTLEFPLLLQRKGRLVARVAGEATAEGALQVNGDVAEGEICRLGYGDMDLIVQGAAGIHHTMTAFAPQVLFLYSCSCRRFLMQDGVELETRPFESVAPTFGFYTYGEFFNRNGPDLLNASMVAVGLREGPITFESASDGPLLEHEETHDFDPLAKKHTRVVTRLMRFIDTVTRELEESNREVEKLSRTDHLTGLANRLELDKELEIQVGRSIGRDATFSVMMMDLDYFKSINDRYGHLVGDKLLAGMADILRRNTRDTDIAGRWGGEEFLVVIPGVTLDKAVGLAEKLRSTIEQTEFPLVGQQTASFGVTAYVQGDNISQLIHRVDTALYRAKDNGRNRVELLAD